MAQRKAPRKLHLDVLAVVVGFVVAYFLLDSQLKILPGWVYLILIVALVVSLFVARQMESHEWAHRLGLAIAGVATIALISSVALLVHQLLDGNVSAENLLRDAGLLWLSNVFVFSLWYWELDSGGPGCRHLDRYDPTDFAFPQTTLGGKYEKDWIPGFTDYLFVAFNSSSAFSPTDTMVLTRRAKLLMMAQSMIAILTLAVLAARAVNTLK